MDLVAAAPMTASVGEQVLFWLLAALTVFFAGFTVTRRNPVTAVMSLVGTFFCLAGIYATLSAHFLAILQILVYAGAIMVLFIFVVMILNREEVSPISWGLANIAGVGAGIYLFYKICRVIYLGYIGLPTPGPVSETFGTVGSIGDMLFRDFLYPFEAISLLLLVAIVGGVIVSRSHQKEVDADKAAAARKEVEDRQLHDYPVQDVLAEAHPSDLGHGGGHH